MTSEAKSTSRSLISFLILHYPVCCLKFDICPLVFRYLFDSSLASDIDCHAKGNETSKNTGEKCQQQLKFVTSKFHVLTDCTDSDEGLVTTQPYGPMTLTETGARMATESQTRHETVYQFLLAIGVSAATAADDAEGIEHHVSAETLKCFRKYLERP